LEGLDERKKVGLTYSARGIEVDLEGVVVSIGEVL
jgi:hypothetical protein